MKQELQIAIDKPKASATKRPRKVEVISSTNPLIPRWRDLDELDKLKWGVRAVQTAGGYAFSLNLSIGREAGFHERENAFRGFQKRLSDAFRDQGLPALPVAAQLESSKDSGRLHLHGVVLPQGGDRRTIVKALRQAGGKIKGRTGSRQCMLKPITDGDGWVGYILKDRGFTDRQTPGGLTYLSTPLRRLARSLFEQCRGQALAANRNAPADQAPTKPDTSVLLDPTFLPADRVSVEDETRMKSIPYYAMV